MGHLDQQPSPVQKTRIAFLVAVSYFLLAIGIAAIGYAGYRWLTGNLFQAIEYHRFEHTVVPSEFHSLAEGAVIGTIKIPRLGLASVVVNGDSAAVLDRAVGHLPETALPGQPGNLVLAAHRDTLFRPLRNVLVGDVVILDTYAGNFQYQVESTSVVPPTDLQVLRPSGTTRELTLITCFPFTYIGSAPNRFIVRATEIPKLR